MLTRVRAVRLHLVCQNSYELGGLENRKMKWCSKLSISWKCLSVTIGLCGDIRESEACLDAGFSAPLRSVCVASLDLCATG